MIQLSTLFLSDMRISDCIHSSYPVVYQVQKDKPVSTLVVETGLILESGHLKHLNPSSSTSLPLPSIWQVHPALF